MCPGNSEAGHSVGVQLNFTFTLRSRSPQSMNHIVKKMTHQLQ